jgi:maleylacetate reductase
MNPFIHEFLPGRVMFGEGSLDRLPGEVERLGRSRVMLIVSDAEAHLGDRAATALAEKVALRWSRIRQHVPVELAAEAIEAAGAARVDLLVSIGGGSTTGLAKAVALTTRLPIVAVPTTYAGSEMTPIWGRTEDGVKTTGRDPVVLPTAVVYDPALTVSLPSAITGASGMNALAHCVEATYARNASPVTTSLAVESVRTLASALPDAVRRPDDLTARSDALYGAFLAGTVLATAGISIHHHVCHVLGGMFDLPHAELHTVVLPQAVAAVATADPGSVRHLASVLGPDVPGALYDLAKDLALPTSLAEIGMSADRIEEAVPRVVAATAGDPTPLSQDSARRLLQDAVSGVRPARP